MISRNTIIGVLIIVLIVLSIQYKKERSKIVDLNVQIIETRDTLFDIRMRYDGLFDEVLRLEYENQILGSYAANKDYKNE
tara:strand:+ start:210 stop:449 length:240 start_codon:yes stop_codon:yes gene_type:complete